jgi:hypothetical protein
MTEQAMECGSEAKAVPEQRTEVQARKLATRMMLPAGCRAYMRRRLAKEFPEIVDGFIEEAKKGSCPHVKLATELLRPVRKGTPRRKSEATKMLDELLGE